MTGPLKRTLLGHPPGLFLVAGTEFWERFSYYGMLGLLVLFLTAPAASGGFAWSQAGALKLYGIYTGLIFAAPALGGWLSATWLGERRCIMLGGLIVAAGHLLLGGPAYFPTLLEWLSGEPLVQQLEGTALDYAHADNATFYLTRMLPGASSWLVAAYLLKVWSFLTGLALIVVGTALIKPTVSSIINGLYHRDDPMRGQAYVLFMVFIYLGSFLANFVAGTLGEKLGWHYGFTAAALGMTLGVGVYLLKQEEFLGDIGKVPSRRLAQAIQNGRTGMTVQERQRIALLLFMGCFTILYAVSFYQKGGLLSLYVRDHVNRGVGGSTLPITWLLSISTGVFMLGAPLLSRFWVLLERRGHMLTALHKLAIGLLLIALAYTVMLGAESQRGQQGSASVLWIVATYSLFGIADIFIWPPQIAAAASLAPARLTSIVVGIWHLTIGIGSWLTGYVGAMAYTMGHASLFMALAASCATAGLMLLAIRHRLIALAGGEAF